MRGGWQPMNCRFCKCATPWRSKTPRSPADAWMRVGLDALTADTYGALAQLALVPEGTRVTRGEPFGSLEAASALSVAIIARM